ncbi:MAG: hypothetical protein V4577_04515 [Bacteroidota bacterium]
MKPLPPSAQTSDVWYTIITILFAISLISERPAKRIKIRLTNKDMRPDGLFYFCNGRINFPAAGPVGPLPGSIVLLTPDYSLTL